MPNKKKCWIGIDCGSVSIKIAIIDENKKLLDTIYVRNRGIVDTVKKGMADIKNDDYDVQGVATTGSGRNFVSLLVGGDLVKTEILAHTIATLHFYPNVRTVLDIGGEDCKIMNVEDGILTNFIMNNICGAGTGSVIETIASRLGIPIEEVGDLAMSSTKDLEFPGKCGVFCQSAVVSRLNSGAKKPDILRGVVRALINNYLSLAKGVKLEPPFVFQGATAQNKAIVDALSKQLNSEVIVPEHCSVMGAIGSALLAYEGDIKKSNFKGFDNISNVDYETYNFQCTDCANRCEVTQLYEDDELKGCIGSRCGKWETQKKDRTQ